MKKGTTMARKKVHGHVGSDFEDFLREDKQLEASTAIALKRVLAWEFQQAMQKANVSQAEMARRMRTSRAVIRRLLDENDPSITLSTISKAANALGKNLRFKLAA
jgi:plasmid maintenance system antidote protein VapI